MTAVPRARSAAFVIGALAVAAVAGCSSIARRPPAPPKAPTRTQPRLALDPEASPLAFRWLSGDAVLIAPTAGKRTLAAFGNYVARAAKGVSGSDLTVWDDEQAWKLAGEGEVDDEVTAHRRAEFVKDLSLAEPIEEFRVFNREGAVVYQRDFRAWPLTELD